MSTKALRMLLEKAELRTFREVLGTAMLEEAKKELEAIERAAKAFAGSGDMEEDLFAEALMKQIAEESLERA